MKNKFGIWLNCLLITVILIINLTAGAWSVAYLVEIFLHKSITFGWSVLIGGFVGEVTIPIAILVLLLHLAGVL